jgi:hypothetical protein
VVLGTDDGFKRHQQAAAEEQEPYPDRFFTASIKD